MPSSVLSQKSSRMATQVPDLYGETQQAKSCNQVVCPLYAPLSPSIECLLNDTCHVPCPWRGNITSSKCTAGRRMFSPSVTQGMPTPHCPSPAPRPSSSLSPRAPLPTQLDSSEWYRLLKPQNLTSTVCKKLAIVSSS